MTSLSSTVDPISDLLRLLDGVDSADLAEFIESEHRELLTLREQVRQYDQAVFELRGHLQHVFSCVGGLSALPMSSATKVFLNLAKQPQSPPNTTSLAPPLTPMSRPASSLTSMPTRRTSFRIVSDPSFQLHPPPRHSSANMTSACAKKHVLVSTEGAEITSMRSVGIQTDQDHSEAVLRERKTQVRTLRKKLQDKELRQFAYASDCVGLKRTESIMIEAPNGWAQIYAAHAGALRAPAATKFRRSVIAKPAVRCKRASTARTFGSKSRQSRILCESGRGVCSVLTAVDQASEDNSETANVPDKQPVGYVNGWPVYADQAPADDDAALSDVAQCIAVEAEASDETAPHNNDNTADLVLSFPPPPTSIAQPAQHKPPPVVHQGIHDQYDYAPENMHYNVSIQEMELPVTLAPRTPRLLRSVVSSSPRRLYSRLSNRLKRI
ncbi:hypothetical protein DL89DRAFT_291481 [Linderina pennispora]|uniref:Uncharacterized protein n=1 Tax=Linderina pennispora TaxID=61395 RepID=A0A1Y1WFF4_9FUNG|nr:uncharacterized protein DL89DRAFT_291481 [Linderina pennispora]ORX72280.1 hypothetical protein DL89DRAFT_291481 [Linderina pennispora]